MNRTTSLRFLATIALVFAARPQTALAATHGGGGATNISVTTVIDDVDGNGLPVIIGSDGLGAYPDGVNGVTSYLAVAAYNHLTYGDWQFSTYNSAARTANYTFEPNDAVQAGDSHYQAPANPPYWGSQLHPTHMEVKCTLAFHDMLTMTAGSSFTCPLITSFVWNGTTTYSLLPAFSFTRYPETADVQVRCNTADSGGCNDWYIDPINIGEAVGRLIQHVTVRNKDVATDEGDFYMRFHVHVTRP